MTPRLNYIGALETAVGYAISQDMKMRDICDVLIAEVASIIAGAARKNPDLDVDALLEIMRHSLDRETAKQLAPPPPPKETA